MVDRPSIGITGATGKLGGRVAFHLSAAGLHQRLLVRDPTRAPQLSNATSVQFTSYGDTDTSVRALSGIKLLYMVSASESEDRLEQHKLFVDAAVKANVQHIIYTSFVGANKDATFTLARDHWATEEHIRKSGLTYTFLRDNFYIDFLPLLVDKNDNTIRGPAGKGRVAAVAREDVARSIVAVLKQSKEHANATYDLTGPEALSLNDVAHILSETRSTGEPVCYQEETVEEAYASREKWQAPQWQLDAWVSTYTSIANGDMQNVTSSVYELTGQNPISFRDYLKYSRD
jgi:NAD(P)H dehydrogenase (quinone)